jgi:hypothetical protein
VSFAFAVLIAFLFLGICLPKAKSQKAASGNYGWIDHKPGSGFSDRPPATLFFFCVFGPVLSSPAHGAPSLAMEQIETEIF